MRNPVVVVRILQMPILQMAIWTMPILQMSKPHGDAYMETQRMSLVQLA